MIHLTDPKNCCGCEACAQICSKKCISLHRDEKGFLYPQVCEKSCIDCGLCEKVCPVYHPSEAKEPKQIYASKNDNISERLTSSSGGVFILLAKQTINQGGVVFGVTFDSDWNPIHSFSETVEGLAQFQGSKYVQSRIDGAYVQAKSFLDAGRRVLFSGTPCQIAGLKLFLRREYDNLLTVEVICHGVPSPKVWQDYKDSIRRPKGAGVGEKTVLSSLNETPSIEGISFRNKQNGWRKYDFVVRFSADQREAGKFGLSSIKAEKEKREYHRDNLYMKAFLKNLILRPSCFSCPAKSGRSGADMSLGDFWSIGRYLKEWNDDKGVTLVYLNSDKGCDYFGSIRCSKIELDPSINYNKMYYASTAEKYPSEEFWSRYKREGLDCVLPICNTLTASNKPSICSRLYAKFKTIVSSFFSRINTSVYF